jgi:hypothetical protein
MFVVVNGRSILPTQITTAPYCLLRARWGHCRRGVAGLALISSRPPKCLARPSHDHFGEKRGQHLLHLKAGLLDLALERMLEVVSEERLVHVVAEIL